jgi:GAF domain-containing protein
MSIAKIEALTKRLEEKESIISSLMKVQGMYILDKSRSEIFEKLLEILLEASKSKYGFIGEILHKNNKPYLKTYAITDISWDKDTKKFYEEHAPKGMEFVNLDSLFGHTISTGEFVITNDPKNHPKSCGLPSGHPSLDSYLGIPFHSNGKIIGMCGIANRNEGYDQGTIEILRDVIDSSSNLLHAHIVNNKGHKK